MDDINTRNDKQITYIFNILKAKIEVQLQKEKSYETIFKHKSYYWTGLS